MFKMLMFKMYLLVLYILTCKGSLGSADASQLQIQCHYHKICCKCTSSNPNIDYRPGNKLMSVITTYWSDSLFMKALNAILFSNVTSWFSFYFHSSSISLRRMRCCQMHRRETCMTKEANRQSKREAWVEDLPQWTFSTCSLEVAEGCREKEKVRYSFISNLEAGCVYIQIPFAYITV